MACGIVEFYSGRGTDHRGRRMEEILGYSDEELEEVHDYIQWLFPLELPSPVNPLAPVVTPKTRQAFAGEESLSANLCRSCRRMMEFYGLECAPGEGRQELRTNDSFEVRARTWPWPGNHNHSRITRILGSLRLLGRSECSAALLVCMEGIAARCPGRVELRTLEFWRNTQR